MMNDLDETLNENISISPISTNKPRHARRIKLKVNPYAEIDNSYQLQLQEEAKDGRGVFISLPFLENGFNWYDLMTVDRNKYNSSDALAITRDHIPHMGAVKRKHILQRLEFLGLEINDINYDNIKGELELHRQLITKTVSSWIKHYIIFVANNTGMSIMGSPIKNWSDYMYWVENFCKTKDDAMIILKSLYISWDYVPDFRFKISICIMMSYNLTMHKADRIGIARNFLEKMITFRINLLKKQVNEACKEYNGFKFTTTRRTNNNNDLDKYIPKYFQPWMIEVIDMIKKNKKRNNNNNDVVTKRKRRNISTYKTDEELTEQDIKDELIKIDELKNKLLNRLNDMRSNNNENNMSINDEQDEEINNEEEWSEDESTSKSIVSDISKESGIQTKSNQTILMKDKLKKIHKEEIKQAEVIVKQIQLKNKKGQDKVITRKKKDQQKKKVDDSGPIWEIEACLDVIFEERPGSKQRRNKETNIYLTCIHNVRKGKGWKMELLVEYNTGERQWAMFHGPLIDLRLPTAKLMKDCGLTLSICGYKTDPTKMSERKKSNISPYDDYNHHNRTNYTLLQRDIHAKLSCNHYNNNKHDEESSEDGKIAATNNNDDTSNIFIDNVSDELPSSFNDNMIELIQQAAMRAAELAINNNNKNNNDVTDSVINL